MRILDLLGTMPLACALLFFVFAAAPATGQEHEVEDGEREQEAEEAPEPTRAIAELRDGDGVRVGQAIISQADGEGLEINVEVSDLEGADGEHGIHIHETGQCSPDFQAAGGHFNPTDAEHGLENPGGPHAGDLPNVNFDAGSASYRETTDRITLVEGDRSILDGDGTALIIHGGPDDQRTDPSGDSGDRLVCGVISAAGEFGDEGADGSEARPVR